MVLCITGGEALYADMGHFGRGPIRLSWLGMVFPALLLNYLGQTALLLENPEAAVNPFYGLVPRFLLYPMVALSTTATVIASQAMISGSLFPDAAGHPDRLLPQITDSTHFGGDQGADLYALGQHCHDAGVPGAGIGF